MSYNIEIFEMVLSKEPSDVKRIEILTTHIHEIMGMYNKEIVGHLSLDIFDEYTAITWVYVEPTHRNKGIASRMIEKSWEITQEKGLNLLGLVVDKSPIQEELMRFYIKKGFKIVPQIFGSENGSIEMYKKKKE